VPDFGFEEESYEFRINSRTLLRILNLARPHWRRVVLFMAAITLVSMLDSVFTYISKQIIDEGIALQNMTAVWRLVGIYASLTLLQSGGVLSFIYLVGILGERIRFDLRRMMFNHLQELQLSYFSQKPVGWIIARVTSDSDRVADLMTWGLLDTTWAISNILTASVFMLSINWKLSLIVYAMIPVIFGAVVYFRRKVLREYRRSRQFNSQITAAYNENITGVRVVKALSREEGNLAEFEDISQNMFSSSYRAAWLSALFLPSVQVISAFALGGVVWLGGRQVQLGTMTIGGIQAFISYILFMMWPIQDMARVFAEIQHAIASAERIFSLVDTHSEIIDDPLAAVVHSIGGEIVFEDVDFYYEDKKPVLRGFNLIVKKGEVIALVGPTGGGKTTIVNLLCRLYQPCRGRILINGLDYTKIRLQDLQSRIGVVLQTPHLFSGSIRENIRYGRLDASDEAVETAAGVVGGLDFISRFEHGFDQQVGEGGTLLSLGQKQLISLARAILAEPEIFIMDEATSSVDTVTEALIQKGMDTIISGKTSFIIAHRLSTIKRADRIVVIDEGRITEMGSHTELLRLGGHYYHLYSQQYHRQMEDSLDPSAASDASSTGPE